ncbi:MAG: reverse transcriptase family protein [Caulobacterales bacterium]|nr:reverse transcriptase family protein [Caulobacterales bacterium]
MPRKSAHHPLNQCCLYKLASRRKLAALLFLSPRGLLALSDVGHRYKCWDASKKDGGTRRIEAPHDNLKEVQKRIAHLLQGIEPPDYLSAPVRGRSYVDNAARHIGARSFRLLDIEDFFPSCTDKRVFAFFHTQLMCAPDVSAILTRLTTFNGHLPQGSPCSPILAYFAYSEMWAEISRVSRAAGCTFSLYADDITLSGEQVLEKDVWAIKQCLFRFGHRYSRRKERSIRDRSADVTGVILSGTELLLPNRQHKEIARIRRSIGRTKTGPTKEHLTRQLRGRRAQERQITGHLAKKREEAGSAAPPAGGCRMLGE